MRRDEDTLRETYMKQREKPKKQKKKTTVCCSSSHEICTLFRILELSNTRELRKMGPAPKKKSATQLLKKPGR